MKGSLLLIVLICGLCIHADEFIRYDRQMDESEMPGSYSVEGKKLELPGPWWLELGCPGLDNLMQRAFQGNLTLQKAWTRLRQINAQRVMTQAAERMQLSSSSSTGRTLRKSNDTKTGTWSFSTGLSASYELDLWHKLGSETRATLLIAQATEEDLQGTALLLSANLAKAWMQQAAQQEQLLILHRQLETNKSSLDLIRLKQRKGSASLIDVLQQQQAFAGVETLIPQAELQLQLIRNRISYMIGEFTNIEVTGAGNCLPELKMAPDTGVPAQILGSRPDIRAAWLRLKAEEQTHYATWADRLPSMRLSGSAQYSESQFRELMDSWSMGLSASLSLPLLDGGRDNAGNKREKALAEQRFIEYRDTVISAVKEVEDALYSEAYLQQYHEKLTQELEFASRALTEAERQYRNGMRTYLSVLTSLQTKQRLERDMVRSRLDLLMNRIDLYIALGGGRLELPGCPAEHADTEITDKGR